MNIDNFLPGCSPPGLCSSLLGGRVNSPYVIFAPRSVVFLVRSFTFVWKRSTFLRISVVLLRRNSTFLRKSVSFLRRLLYFAWKNGIYTEKDRTYAENTRISVEQVNLPEKVQSQLLEVVTLPKHSSPSTSPYARYSPKCRENISL